MSNVKLGEVPYLRHPELKLLFRKEYIRFFLFLHVPFFIMVLFKREFPDFLATMDAMIIGLAIIHACVVKPLMKKGKIRAYYRKHYRTESRGSFLSVMYTALWFGALFRAVLLIINFLLQYVSFEKSEIPSLMQSMKLNYMSVNGTVFGFLLFTFFMYILYYKDRYISIEEFSNRSIQYVREYGWSVEEAMRIVLSEPKKTCSLETKNAVRIKPDLEKDVVRQTTIIPIRRQARR
ncbi:hypothetical protein [Paenibacillus polymyxa]|uniref:Uncharacterized protein n=1 Tax=Paenibacillus polymyxa (strain SC2) TaxID=886882 RepID=E3EKD1_PAEPS|nr:hypothetical protein [Paenibacillus polymyxa]ADO59458.1 hypothetical protein PPSC2_27775 [Paenibacillus polymyxa SC2]WPQ59703.1 hypothetical protein SKN87_29015 [Paenibacillus polymyxa]